MSPIFHIFVLQPFAALAKKSASHSSRGVKREIVVAPPGCGKTDELSRRLTEAINSNPPRSVLCITFTENAAIEMKERAQKALPKGSKLSDSQRICTLHSYCWRKLRDEAQDKGEHLHVVDDGYLREFAVESRLDAFNDSLDYDWKESPEIRLEQIVRAASYQKRGKNVIFEPWRSKAWQEKFNGFIKKYITFKEDLNELNEDSRYLDFNDILIEAYTRLKEGDWTERFDIVLVDEVQDLSPFQLDIIESLVKDNGSICFFGDPEQAIYSFMGANVKKLYSLWKSCDESNRHSLHVNYRSPAHILRIINKYARNRIRVDKMWPGFNMKWEQKPSRAMARVPVPEYGTLRLTHNKYLDEDIALYHARSLKQEIREICEIIDTFPVGESNAILTLHNRKVDEVVALLKQKKKYVILGASEDEHTFLPRIMCAHLLVCQHSVIVENTEDDPENKASRPDENPWVGILAFLVKGEGRRRIAEQLRKLRRYGVTPLDVMAEREKALIRDARLLADNDILVLIKALRDYAPLFSDCTVRLESLKGCPEEELNKLLGDWIAYCHKHLVTSGLLFSYQDRQWDTIIRKIKKELKYACPSGKRLGLVERLDLVERLLSDIRPDDLLTCYGPDRRRIHVMTVHKAKGLGFDNVFMCSADQTWDYSRTAERDRVFFVGMTRAKKRLMFSFSDPTPTQEDLEEGRKPKSRLKDFSFIEDTQILAEEEGAF